MPTAPRPTVPISYVLLMIDLVAAYGVSREALLDGMEVPGDLLQKPDGRVGLLEEYARLCHRALQLTGEPALAYEFGLRASVTTHGLVGYGLMSQATLRDVFRFADRFGSTLRLPAWNLRFFTEGDEAGIEGTEAVSHGSLKRFSCEQLLVSFSSILRHLLPPDPEFRLLFEHAEPDYHARYRERLPRVHFNAGVTQIRVPASYLDRPLGTADRVSAQLAERECERELALLGHDSDLLKQVRAALQNTPSGYADLDTIAAQLHLSSRTLVRRLGERKISFRQLLDEARRRDSVQLLRETDFNLSQIASRLGYSSAANFSRAFRGWHGVTPGTFRER